MRGAWLLVPALLLLTASARADDDEQCDGDLDCDGWPGQPADPIDPDEAWDPELGRVWDCDDTDELVYPGAPEDCDSLVDRDCDGQAAAWWCAEEDDPDRDGFTQAEGDCDSSDPEVGPDAPERCNGVDDDCDQEVDEDCGVADCMDLGGGGLAFGLLFGVLFLPRLRGFDGKTRSSVGASILMLGCTPTPPQDVAEAYYVAGPEHGGSDDNDGLAPSLEEGGSGPFGTIAHAAALMEPGDMTLVRAGTYLEANIHFGASGTEAEPIVLANYEPDEPDLPLIDGSGQSVPLTGIRIAASPTSDWEQPHWIQIEGFEIGGMAYRGIATEWWAETPYVGIEVRRVSVHDNGLEGILLAAVEEFVVEDVHVEANGADGLAIIGSSPNVGGLVSASSGDVGFVYSLLNLGRGLSINQGYEIGVHDSVARDNGNHGFDVSDWPRNDGTDLVSHNVYFVNNVSKDNGSSGFSVNSWSYDVVYARNVSSGNADGFRCYLGCPSTVWENNTAIDNDNYGFLVIEPTDGVEPPSFAPPLQTLRFRNNLAWSNGDDEWPYLPALAIEGQLDPDGLPIGQPLDDWLELEALNNEFSGFTGDSLDPYDAPFDDKVVIGLGSLDPDLAAAFGGAVYTQAEVNEGAFNSGADRQDNFARDLLLQAMDPDGCLWGPTAAAGIDSGADPFTDQPFCGAAPDRGAYEVCE